MKNKNVFNFIGFESSYEEAQMVFFGAPFDGTTSFRPGTRFAPNIIRNDSYGLETYSPYLNKDIEDYNVYDMGDLEFPFGNPAVVVDSIYEATKSIINDNKIPFMVGGEHLVSLGSIKAVHEKYPDLHVVHLDAHTDLREDYMGEKLSHATILRRAFEFLGDDRIYQFGIRSGTKEEFEWAKKHTHLYPFTCEDFFKVKDKLKGKPVYITIDLDVLDPSIFCGTGTIEPGGISFKELLDVLKGFDELNIVGADVVELSPHYDQSGMSTAVACKVIRELTLAIF